MKKLKHQLKFEAIGTTWVIDIYSEVDISNLKKKILRRIAIFDKTYSRFRDDSKIMQLSRKAGCVDLPEDANDMIAIYKTLYQLTDARFTPLIGTTLEQAGYDRNYSFKKKVLTPPPPLDSIMTFKDSKLCLKQPAILDLGALGKGKLIDIVAEIISSFKISEFSIEAGGDILHKASFPLRIGLENPKNSSQAIGVAKIHSKSICSSSGLRRAWGEYHHIINPKKLESESSILGSWVVAETAMVADALSTSLFFTNPKKLLKKFSFEYIVVDSNMNIAMSSGFPARIFTKT